MHTTSLFPLWFKAAIRMHCVYSRQLEFGTIFQSPNGLDAFWSHRLPRRHSLVHSHSGILITNTPLLFLGGGQSFVSVSPSVGHASISFVCQQGVFKALSPRLLTLSWCGAGSPAVLPSEFAPPALCSQSAEFPTTPGKSSRYIVKFRHASSIATSLMGYPSSKLSTACLAQPLHSPPSWLAPDT